MVRGSTTEAAMEERATMPIGPDWIADVIAVMVTLFNDVLVLLLLLLLLVVVSMGEMSPPRMWILLIVLNGRRVLLFSFTIVFLFVVGFTKADAISKEFAKRNRKMII